MSSLPKSSSTTNAVNKTDNTAQPVWWVKYYWWLFATGVVVLAFLSFWQLGADQVRNWDEARHGINAYEMIKQGDYVANYYNGNLDYWNLKPPLSFYLVMLGYQIFGYNAWGLRFFSALAYVVLAVIVALYLRKKFNPLSSLLALLLFAGNYWYIAYHCVRTGDADALFILLIGIAYVAMLLSRDNANWLHLTGFAVALAFLTKSYHAFIMLPIIFLYLLFTKGFKQIKWWQYLTVAVVTLAPVAVWAGLRATVDGGKFFHDMLFVDVLKRSSQAVEGHTGFPFFYLLITLGNAVNIVAIALLLFNLISKFHRREAWDNLDKATLIAWFSIWLIYALASSKLQWYVYPLCVPFTLYAAVRLSTGLTAVNWPKAVKITSLVVIGLCVVASTVIVSLPRSSTELQTLITNELPAEAAATYYFQDGTSTTLQQAELLVFEWRTGQLITSGGANAFSNAEHAYLIIRRDADYTPVADATVVADSAHYVVYYRGAHA